MKHIKSGDSVFVVIVLIALATIIILIISSTNDPCGGSGGELSYECRAYQVELCIADEQYTREECITLVGGR
jgi:hypothetical protein